MKATTHTERYRPFEGTLKERPLRAVVLARSALRQAFRKKLGALLLFAPTVLVAVGMSVRVNFKYSFMKRTLGSDPTPEEIAEAIARSDQEWGSIADTVVGRPGDVGFMTFGVLFAILAMVWYGAGMISDDRRLGANLLYFSRPLTRTTYGVGKFLGLFLIGVLTLIAPAMLICMVAAFTSPDWYFVREEGGTVLRVLLLSTSWVVVLASTVLGLSSLAPRRSHALILSFGVILILNGVAAVAAELTNQPLLIVGSLFVNFEGLKHWLFDYGPLNAKLGAEVYAIALATWVSLAMWLLSRGIRKMEVVG